MDWRVLLGLGAGGALLFLLLPRSGLPPADARISNEDAAVSTVREAAAKAGLRTGSFPLVHAFVDKRLLQPGKNASPGAGRWQVHLRGGEPQALALLDFDGRLLALEQDIQSDAAGASLDDPAARALAERFLAGVGLYPTTLRLVGAVATARKARVDHQFIWSGAGGSRVRATVTGNRVTTFFVLSTEDDAALEKSQKKMNPVMFLKAQASGVGYAGRILWATAWLLVASLVPAAIFLARRQGWRLRRSGPWLAVGLVAVVVSLLIELLRGEYLLIPQDPFTLLGLVLAALLVVVAALLFPAALALLEAARAEQLLSPSFAEAARENPAMAMVCAAAIGCCILGLLTLVAAALRLVPGSAQYSGWGALGSRAWAGPLERLISLFPFGLMRVTVFAVLLTLTRSRWAAAAPTAILFNMLDLPLGVTPWGLERGLALFESSAVTAVLVWLGPLAAVGAEMACFASGSLLSLVRFGAPGDALLSVLGLAIVVGIAASSIPQVRQLLGRRDTLAETPTVPSPRSTPDIGPVSPPGSTPEAISGIEPGVVLAGRYQVTSEIGRGGMGRVLRARDLKLGRAVAVKVLNPGVHDDKQRQRFEQEARAAGALNHPNILAVHDVGEHDGDPYIVSELLEGETLRKVLLSGALPSAEALDLATQVAAGLAAAHAKGIVHRDLKPENLFLTDDGRLKILDFGIAKLLDSHGAPQALTETGAILGTPAYMSPEQVRGQRSDERSDVFSFGAVLHEMLAGEGPFNRDTAPETGYAILNDPPGPLPASTSALLRRVVTRCLQKSPDERYANAGEILHDLGQQPRRFALKPGA